MTWKTYQYNMFNNCFRTMCTKMKISLLQELGIVQYLQKLHERQPIQHPFYLITRGDELAQWRRGGWNEGDIIEGQAAQSRRKARKQLREEQCRTGRKCKDVLGRRVYGLGERKLQSSLTWKTSNTQIEIREYIHVQSLVKARGGLCECGWMPISIPFWALHNPHTNIHGGTVGIVCSLRTWLTVINVHLSIVLCHSFNTCICMNDSIWRLNSHVHHRGRVEEEDWSTHTASLLTVSSLST